MGKIINIFNQKGGSAKTTSALNIATELAKIGKTLIIDNDGQGNATYICLELNEDEFDEKGHGTIHELLIDRKVKAEDVVYQTVFENLDIIPATIDHVYTDMQLISAVDNNRVLMKKLKGFKDNYDFIIIDNPPAISLSTYNSLMVADVVVAPIESSVFSAKGLKNLVELMEDINDNRDKKLKLLTFMSKVDNRKKVKNIQTKNVLESVLGDAFIKEQHISVNTAYVDSLEDGETAVTWKKDNVGKQEYKNLTRLILDKMED
ncbi:ParA family protein [Clostridium perfringens]|uniref:ParA family protein n=1 Tax=Clostridium perfringens TaxID=1502 RepID=UPI00290B434B|nr:AAA family ATPase [Clostridium perfringens]